jgi:hypothetical protein
LGFKDNRIKAFYIGFEGNLFSGFSYRIQGTDVYGYGTQGKPFLKRVHDFSGLVECIYNCRKWKGWEFALQLSGDQGTMYGNNTGCSMRITKTDSFYR